MDVGHFDKPVLIFGGPYSNLQALEALRKIAEEEGIPAERIFCTGDIVAYCGQPCEVVDSIRDWGIHVLMGNCEESFATDADDCGCGFSEGSSCDLLSVQWFQFANQRLKPEHRSWFKNLPRKIHFTLANKRVRLVHGSASRINQFIFASHDDAIFTEQMKTDNAEIFIGGHSGIPFTKKIANKLWLNAGAIGMPANDGSQRTWYSILAPSSQQPASEPPDRIHIKTKALEYDAQLAHNIMQQNGLNNGYADALLNGLWPSMDVLPETEKQQQGKPIQAWTLDYPC